MWSTWGDITALSAYDSGLKVTPSRIRLGRIAVHSEQGTCSIQQAPDGSRDPTWEHTTLSVTSSGAVGIGIRVPQDGARLHALGNVLCNNLSCTLLKADDIIFQYGSYLSERLSTILAWTTVTSVTAHVIPLAGGPLQEHRLYLEKDAPPQASTLRDKAVQADGAFDTISYNSWRVGPGWVALVMRPRPQVLTQLLFVSNTKARVSQYRSS